MAEPIVNQVLDAVTALSAQVKALQATVNAMPVNNAMILALLTGLGDQITDVRADIEAMPVNSAAILSLLTGMGDSLTVNQQALNVVQGAVSSLVVTTEQNFESLNSAIAAVASDVEQITPPPTITLDIASATSRGQPPPTAPGP